MKESNTQTSLAQSEGYISWDVMIKSISDNGCTEKTLRDLFEKYAISRVIQVKKQLAEEIIDDCNELVNSSKYKITLC